MSDLEALAFLESAFPGNEPSGGRKTGSATGKRSVGESRDASDAVSFGYGYEEEERLGQLYGAADDADDADAEDDDDFDDDDEGYDDADDDDFEDEDDVDDEDEDDEDDPPVRKRGRPKKSDPRDEQLTAIAAELRTTQQALRELQTDKERKAQEDEYEAGRRALAAHQARWAQMSPEEAREDQIKVLGQIAGDATRKLQEYEKKEDTARQLTQHQREHREVMDFLAAGHRNSEEAGITQHAAEPLTPDEIEILENVAWDAWVMQETADKLIAKRKAKKQNARRAASAARRERTRGAEGSHSGRSTGGSRVQRAPQNIDQLMDQIFPPAPQRKRR